MLVLIGGIIGSFSIKGTLLIYSFLFILGIFILVFLLFYKKYSLLVLLLFILPLINIINRIPNFNKFLFLFDKLIIIIIFFWFFYLLINYVLFKKTLTLPYKLDILDILITFFILISIIQIFNPNLNYLPIGLTGFKVVGVGLLVYFIGRTCIKNRDDLVKIFQLIVIMSLPISIYGLLQSVIGLNIYDQIWLNKLNSGYVDGENIKIFSTLNSSFELAMYLGICIIIGVNIFNTIESFSYKILIFLCVLINCIALFLTLVRGSWVALIIALLVPLFVSINIKKSLLYGILFYLITIVIIKVEYFEVISKRLSTLLNPMSDSSIIVRMSTWTEILQSVKSNPLGFGLGSTGGVSQYFYKQGLINYVASDNQYLSILYETGFIGLLIFITILLIAIIKGFIFKINIQTILDKKLILIFISITIFLIVANISNNALQLFPINYIFWFILGLQISFQQISSNNSILYSTKGVEE